MGIGGIYQECGKQHLINLVLDKNRNKIGIAMGIKSDESITKNCLNYTFLACCGEKTPQIFGKRKGRAVFTVPEYDDEEKPIESTGYHEEEREVDFEVQRFFPHDGDNNYFSPNVNDIKLFVPYKSEGHENRKLYGFMIEGRWN